MIRTFLFAIAVTVTVPAAAQSQGNSSTGWRFSLTPYLWLPNISGTMKYGVPTGGSGSPTVESGADDYLKNLDMAVMLTGEARKGDWAIFTDVIYLDFAGEDGSVKTVSGPGGIVQVPVNTGTQTGLKGYVWQLAASRVVSRSDRNTFEILGGFRYLGIESSVNWQFSAPLGLLPQSGNATQKVDLWDGIVGIRGKARFGGSWFVPYYLDAGTGSSELTWQGLVGVGYSYQWGDVLLAYRHLHFDQSGDTLVQDISFSGPALGVSFRF